MKKLIIGILCFCMFMTVPVTGRAYAQTSGMQAAWVTTVYNQDWPKTKNNIESQKQEMRTLLDTLKDTGINTIMFQARTQGDALYKSNINPWSSVLTGTQGKDPGYDPLQFVIQEAKSRGMQVHVWLNPYRVTTSGTDLSKLSDKHPAKQNPSWVLSHNDRLYYNPELPEVKQHIVDTVAEIVNNYQVDGVHFDDYFYPSKYPLPDGETKDGPTANARRSHINDMITKVRNKIKLIKPSVQFGVSPSGIWKNNSSDPLGSETRGNESYYSDFADTRYWVKNNMIDYIVPQIYWERGHSAADYETLVKWWSGAVSGTNVKLYIGQGIYKDEVAVEIDKQLEINDTYSEVLGSVYFSSIDIVNNRQNCKIKIKEFLKSIKLSDIKGHWAYDAIKDFVDKSYIGGYEDGTFRPNNSITRAEFVKILNQVFGLTKTSGVVFEDTKNHWARTAIDIAVTNGVCNGKSATEFKPNDPITREEVAVMIAAYKKITDTNLDKLSAFKDSYKTASWAKPALEGVIEHRYLGGYEDNTIRPKNQITRAEAVVTLSRIK